MHREGDRIRFTPTDLTVFLASEFASWMDRWELERHAGATALPLPPTGSGLDLRDLPLFAAPAPAPGVDCRPDEPDEDALCLQRKGREHERGARAVLAAAFGEVVDLSGTTDPEATRRAMDAGAPVLYQAPLADEVFVGRPDFVVRRADAGLPPHYAPVEAKLARTPKPEHLIQLCAYADLLQRLQGVRPAALEIVLGDGRRAVLQADRYVHYHRHLRRAFLEFQRRFDPDRVPHPGESSRHGRWHDCAERIIAATDHLRGAAAIRGSQIRRLERAGIATMTDLAALAPRDAAPAAARRAVPGMRAEALHRLALQAKLQLASRGRAKPLHALLPHATGERRGLALLPPASPADIFFDMEGHPLADGQLEYLYGVVHLEDGSPEFADWWALRRTEERAAFEAFVDWVHARWRRDPALHVYHYNAYETAALKRLMGQHGTREREVDDFLRHGVFVDLYQVVRGGVAVGTPNYSLKDLEPLYTGPRAGKVKTAEGCMAAFERWLDAPDGTSWQDSPTLAAIRDYNRADCTSTLELAEWLRTAQRTAGIEYVPQAAAGTARPRRRGGAGGSAATPPADAAAEQPKGGAADDRARARQEMVQRLLERAAAAGDPEAARLDALVAHLLEFHRRERKPAWWRTFERQTLSEEELEEDLECLAGLERTATPPRADGRAVVFEYRYDPEQETKLEAGDRCLLAGNIAVHVEIATLDPESGRVELHAPGRGVHLPPRLSLLPEPGVPDRVLEDALHRLAKVWCGEGKLPAATHDFLGRRPPRIAGHAGGPIVPAGVDVAATLGRAVLRLMQSTLCIQGPPGTGKTYTASQVILELLREGQRVGVLAHGHKAVLNLMAAVRARADEDGVDVLLLKVGGEAEDVARLDAGIAHLPQNIQIAAALDMDAEAVRAPAGSDGGTEGAERPLLPGRLVGGTAWAFARESVEQAFDVLFVDEAGQVSVANLVAAGGAARNLVLVGDQMQLAQPVQGSHPGESGQSALEYLLQGRATIPDDFGVFLATTHRMHPEICSFVSAAVYEGRLHAVPATAARRIVLPPAAPAANSRDGAAPDPARLLRRGTGIVWLPVEHRDNAQSSEEEVEAVVALVDELLQGSFHDRDGSERPLGMGDILVVAPYNAQVQALRRRLPRRARVGSVDRFQGLEAPVVIVSMCASTLEDVPRGLEFLLSPNRINVAVSRAQCLAMVVGSPSILASRCTSLEQMQRLDLYCRLVDHAERLAGAAAPGRGPRRA